MNTEYWMEQYQTAMRIAMGIPTLDQAPEWFDYESPEERKVWDPGLNYPETHLLGVDDGPVTIVFTSEAGASKARDVLISQATILSDHGIRWYPMDEAVGLTQRCNQVLYLLNEDFGVELVVRPPVVKP